LVAIAREKDTAKPGEAEMEPTGSATAPSPPAPSRSLGAASRRLYREYFQRYRYIWLGASLVVLTICLAVNIRPDERPRRVRVSGQVLLDDKPLTNGVVVLIPQQGRSAVATLDEEGRFTLSCYGKEDGAVLGSYGVEIAMAQVPGKDDPPWPVPSAYTNHRTSGLTAEITRSTRDLVFRLSSDLTEPLESGRATDAPLRPDRG
jgi:hypothetical protein